MVIKCFYSKFAQFPSQLIPSEPSITEQILRFLHSQFLRKCFEKNIAKKLVKLKFEL